MKILSFLLYLLFTITVVYGAPIAKVTALVGEATVLPPGKPGNYEVLKLKVGDEIEVLSSILTYDKSFLKLEFINYSAPRGTMTIGPKSKIVLEKFERNQPGVMRLLAGNVRSQIIGEKKKNRSKLFIKTQTAAMGIRGTDFSVIYNPKNHITTLVTIDGNVAFSKVEEKDLRQAGSKQIRPLNEETLDLMLKKKDSVLVSEGRFSGILPHHNHPILPTKISREQQKVLEMTMENKKDNEIVVEDAKKLPPPEGINTKDKYAPRSGGFIDFDSGLYVPPAANAKFDKNEKIYIASANLGHINEETGDYIPPQGLILDETQGFVALDESNEYTVAQAQIMNKSIEKELLPTSSSINGRDEYWDNVFVETPDWWFLYATQGIGYDSNVTRKLYYETVKVTQEPSVYEETFFLFKVHSNFVNGWTINPSLKGNIRYHNRHEIPKIYSNNYLDGVFKNDFVKNHDLLGFNSFFTATLGYHHQQMVLKEEPKIKKGTRKYHRDFNFGFAETIQFSSNLQSKLSYQNLVYRDFSEDENGLLHIFAVESDYRLKNADHLKLKFDYAVKDSTMRAYDGYYSLIRGEYELKEIWESANIVFFLQEKFTNRTDQRIRRGIEKEINPGIEIKQSFLEHGIATFYYNYANQLSKDKVNYDFSRTQLGINLGLSF